MNVLKLCRWKLIGWGMSNMPHPKDPDMGISASKFVPHGAQHPSNIRRTSVNSDVLGLLFCG